MVVMTESPSSGGEHRPPGSVGEVFLVFLRLGLTSFGGPVAHLGYFREAFVERRKWLGDRAYADLVALCQFLPGPASSQVGMAIGLHRALLGEAEPDFTGETVLGALARYVETPNRDFQPMNANFGILDPYGKPIRGKKMRYEALAARSLKKMDEIIAQIN